MYGKVLIVDSKHSHIVYEELGYIEYDDISKARFRAEAEYVFILMAWEKEGYHPKIKIKPMSLDEIENDDKN